MDKHGIYVNEIATGVATPAVAVSGVPFVIGVAPVHSAEKPAKVNEPVLCTSWDEAVAKLGYSEDWDNYSLCEFMYSHFKLFACQPVVFCNVFDPTQLKEAVSSEAAVYESAHKIKLPFEALDTSALVLVSGESTLVKGTDYETYYGEDVLYAELLPGSDYYDAVNITVSYDKGKPSSVTATMVGNAVENIEKCLTTVGIVPDLIVAPKFSSDSTVASLMAIKAEAVNGLFKAKAIIDIDTTTASDYDDAITKKIALGLTDANEIVCWPMVKFGTRKFHLSTQVAGLIASVDTNNEGCPYESPSNKNIKCDSLISNGAELSLTLAQANILNANGIVTAINFTNGWVAWGNYTGCYPDNIDVKDYFIPVNRMFGWVGNTLIRTFWNKLDKPMNRRLVDSIVDSANIWLNGLVGAGYLLGARVEMIEGENPVTNLMAGIIKLHVYITPPSPAQEIDFVLEYDANYVESAFA